MEGWGAAFTVSAEAEGRQEPAASPAPAGRAGWPDGAAPVARVLIALVKSYQRLVSPLLPPRCRFVPSCSAYAVEALRVHGAARGTLLAAWRLARCHPFNPGGYDPVPPRSPGRRVWLTGAGKLSTGKQGS